MILDLVKVVVDWFDIEVVMVFFIVGMCVVSILLSVMYDESGNFIRVDYYKCFSYLMFVDLLFLFFFFIEYMKSGIGDMLVKWYEVEVVIRNMEVLLLMVQVGLRQVEYICDLLLCYSEAVVESMEKGRLLLLFIYMVEMIIMFVGMVGGYGGCLCRMVGVYVVYNGFSFFQEIYQVLYGQKVVYGILVQFVFENWSYEIEELFLFYCWFGFFVSFFDFGICDSCEEVK